MPKVANIVGARPQFIKAGPVSRALREAGVEELLVNTGQHYEPLMSDEIMRDIRLRDPDINLGVGSGSHADQTAAVLIGVEEVLKTQSVDAVVVYGDTNTTLGAALASVKMGAFTAHVEAGLRSFNRTMPEEINRVITDRVCDALYAPTETAMANLVQEGLEDHAELTGDVMVDALKGIDFDRIELPIWAVGEFCIATIHRPANTDDANRLKAIIDGLGQIEMPTHILLHPRLRDRLAQFGIGFSRPRLSVRAPLSYAQMLAVLRASRALVTDSGGLQKEAYLLGVPCVTLRDETEWPETLEGGRNVLSAPEDDLNSLVRRHVSVQDLEPFGGGNAAVQIVDHLAKHIG